MSHEIKIIRKFIKILESKLRFKGSPKGGGAATPYYSKEIKPALGSSEYEYENLQDEDNDFNDEKVDISKKFKKGESQNDTEWMLGYLCITIWIQRTTISIRKR